MFFGKYTRIEKVKFTDGIESFFLTHDGIEPDYEVDLESDFFFNELDVAERQFVIDIASLSELLDFCAEHKIALNNRLETGVLYVGGAADMVVNEALEYAWAESF